MRLKHRLLVFIVGCGCCTFFAGDVFSSFIHTKQPVVSNVRVSAVTSTSATVSWVSAAAADSQVEYGATTAYGAATTLDLALVRSHSQVLSGLVPNTLYHFSVTSRIADGTAYSAGDFTFATPPVVVNSMISGPGVSALSGTSASISWTTDRPTNAIVEFGPTFDYGQFSSFSPAFVTSHTVVLSGLQFQTTYHFRVKSSDGNGNLGISSDSTFTTAEVDLPPLLSAISASAGGGTSVTVSWNTSSPATSQVDYGSGSRYGNSTAMDQTLTTSHSQTLNGLTPNTLYHYRVKSTDAAGVAATSSDFTVATPSSDLFYPQLSLDTDTHTGIAIANFDSGTAQLSFTGFEATGMEVAPVDPSSASKTLNANSQIAAVQDQLFGLGIPNSWPLGWTMLDSSTPHVTGFFLTFNSSLSLLDGAEVLSKPLSSFVLPETGSHDFTTLLLANTNPADASIEIDLVKNDGTVRSSIQTSIPGFGTYSADLATATFAGTDSDPSDYVRVVASQGLLPYEYFGDVSKDLAVLAGQDVNAGSATLYSPQYVVGGGYSSTLSIVNLDATPGTVRLTLIGDDGSQIGTTQEIPIAAKGKIYVTDQAFFSTGSQAGITQGYVKIASDGIRLSGNVVYGALGQGTFSTALPLVSTLQQSVALNQVASNDTWFTGLAVVNPNDTSANVEIDLFDSSGTLLGTASQSLGAGQRVSRLLTEYFPSAAGQDLHSGYVKLTADKGFASFGLFGTKSMSVLSAIPTQPLP